MILKSNNVIISGLKDELAENASYVDDPAIYSIAYNALKEELLIQFGDRDGSVYRYTGVPIDVYAALWEADSAIIYFQEYIRDNYSYQKVS